MEGGRGSWIRDIVSPDGFADDAHVGWERSRGVRVTPAFWPESLKGDAYMERRGRAGARFGKGRVIRGSAWGRLALR